MIQHSFSGLCCTFLLHCCSLYAAVGALLPWETGHVSLCLTPTAGSYSQSQSALLVRVRQGSAAVSMILLFSFCICLKEACKCFWSRKSRLWLRSNCHKLKTGDEVGEKGKKKRKKWWKTHGRETLFLLETDTILFTYILAQFLCSSSCFVFKQNLSFPSNQQVSEVRRTAMLFLLPVLPNNHQRGKGWEQDFFYCKM